MSGPPAQNPYDPNQPVGFPPAQPAPPPYGVQPPYQPPAPPLAAPPPGVPPTGVFPAGSPYSGQVSPGMPYEQPAYGQPAFGQPGFPGGFGPVAPPPPPKRRVGLVIGVVAAVLVVAVGTTVAIVFAMSGGDNKAGPVASNSASASASPSPSGGKYQPVDDLCKVAELAELRTITPRVVTDGDPRTKTEGKAERVECFGGLYSSNSGTTRAVTSVAALYHDDADAAEDTYQSLQSDCETTDGITVPGVGEDACMFFHTVKLGDGSSALSTRLSAQDDNLVIDILIISTLGLETSLGRAVTTDAAALFRDLAEE